MGKNIKFRTLLDTVRRERGHIYVDGLILPFHEIDLREYEQFVATKDVTNQAKLLLEDVMDAARKGKPEGLQEMMRNFRMPFDHVYIEVTHSDGNITGVLADRRDEYVRASVLTNVVGTISVGFIEVHLPLNKQYGGLDWEAETRYKFTEKIEKQLIKKYGKEEVSRAAARSVDSESESDEEKIRKCANVGSTVFDVLVGTASILNAKNGTTLTVVPAILPPPGAGKRARKNKSRSRFTVISLTDYETVDSEGNITPRKLIAAHKVRGHFKRTKTGLSWWRPHVRGHGELQEREAYIVKP